MEVKVGVGVLIKKSGKILLMKRKTSHGKGSWSTPGGHVDFGEDPKVTAIRECYEETAVKCKNIQFIDYTNDFFEVSGKHYITLWFIAEWVEGDGVIHSEREVEEILWIYPDNLPEPLFIPMENFLKGHDLKRLIK